MPYLLIVDDDQPLANALATVLSNAGYEVGVEFSVENAQESMVRRKPDLVLLDVMFPGDMTAGFSMARKMRHYKKQFRDVPILMMTAINDESSLNFSKSDIDENWLPVADFVAKPVDFDVMLEKISTLLEASRAADKPHSDEEKAEKLEESRGAPQEDHDGGHEHHHHHH